MPSTSRSALSCAHQLQQRRLARCRRAACDRRCGCRPRRRPWSCCARRSATRDRRRPAPPPGPAARRAAASAFASSAMPCANARRQRLSVDDLRCHGASAITRTARARNRSRGPDRGSGRGVREPDASRDGTVSGRGRSVRRHVACACCGMSRLRICLLRLSLVALTAPAPRAELVLPGRVDRVVAAGLVGAGARAAAVRVFAADGRSLLRLGAQGCREDSHRRSARGRARASVRESSRWTESRRGRARQAAEDLIEDEPRCASGGAAPGRPARCGRPRGARGGGPATGSWIARRTSSTGVTGASADARPGLRAADASTLAAAMAGARAGGRGVADVAGERRRRLAVAARVTIAASRLVGARSVGWPGPAATPGIAQVAGAGDRAGPGATARWTFLRQRAIRALAGAGGCWRWPTTALHLLRSSARRAPTRSPDHWRRERLAWAPTGTVAAGRARPAGRPPTTAARFAAAPTLRPAARGDAPWRPPVGLRCRGAGRAAAAETTPSVRQWRARPSPRPMPGRPRAARGRRPGSRSCPGWPIAASATPSGRRAGDQRRLAYAEFPLEPGRRAPADRSAWQPLSRAGPAPLQRPAARSRGPLPAPGPRPGRSRGRWPSPSAPARCVTRAGRAAWLPELRLRVERRLGRSESLDLPSGRQRRDGPLGLDTANDVRYEVRATWDLSRLVFNPEEVAASTRP